MSRDDAALKKKDDRKKPSRGERITMVFSILVTVALFAYTAFMGATAPDRPEVGVEVVRTEAQADAVHVHLAVTNRGSVGYSEVTVEVTCADPAPSVTVPNLPATGMRRAVVVCPEDTTTAQAQLVSWVPA